MNADQLTEATAHPTKSRIGPADRREIADHRVTMTASRTSDIALVAIWKRPSRAKSAKNNMMLSVQLCHVSTEASR